MKAIEIASRNHVPAEHIIVICNELGIPCMDENSDISEKDIFLVEKKIEVIKTEKAKKTLELIEKRSEEILKAKQGKKIKLKRKVQISKGLIKEKSEGSPKHHEKPIKPIKKQVQTSEPISEGKKHGTVRQESVVPKEAVPSKDEKTSIKEFAKDTSSKKQKGKVKEKEKDIKRKFKDDKHIEKDIYIRKKKPQTTSITKEVVTPKKIEIIEGITIGDLAHKLNVKANEVISKLMKLGVMATINQVIDVETAEILAGEYNTEVKVISLFEETVIKSDEEDRPEDRVTRPPIVTVMGHVDHGKTKLLDTIRKTNVIDQEFGGITQHIGAYMIKANNQYISFLDTPGHEAFTTMRARGAKVTDIVVLVVDVNDGVMSQTIEAIDHAKDADVPIIVAINKIDLANSNPQKVKQELSNYGIVPEEWGGNTLFAEISAKMGTNIDELLELILIQAEMLELKANPKLRGRGAVLDARLDSGRGPVPTILVQEGNITVGDPFVIGVYSGKVRAMFDDRGNQITKATPSTPVEILGITGMPSAGDPFQVVESEKYSKQIAQKRQELKRIETAKKIKKVTLENLNEMIKEGEIKELRIIIKADVDGSVQTLQEALEKLSMNEIRVKVIHAGTGAINESDIMLASASNAITIGYHVRPSSKVADLAERERVSIQYYNVIFEATNDIKAAMNGMLSPELKEEIIGSGEIRQIFKISKVGTIAGAKVLTGKLQKKNKIRLIRDGVVIFDSTIKSLKRYQNDVNEIGKNQECGFSIEGFNDIKEGDTFEAYRTVEVAKTIEI